MNKAELANLSAVIVVRFTAGQNDVSSGYVLRCFRCDWGMTFGPKATWADVLHTGIEHEEESHPDHSLSRIPPERIHERRGM